MRRVFIFIISIAIAVAACNSPKEHTAAAIRARDSVAMMTSYGINTMISDSGVMKYRIVAERWEINENINPPRWIFSRGLFLEQFDEQFHIEAYIQSDSAYYLTQQKIWHLVGNVNILTIDGLRFNSQELYWDQERHELYSTKFSHIVTPTQEMQGTYFRSDEQMRNYLVTNSKGSFEKAGIMKEDTTKTNPSDSASLPTRQPVTPRRKIQ